MKKHIIFLTIGALCVVSLLWVSTPRRALLDNDPPSGVLEIPEEDVPLAGGPAPEEESEQDPFAAFPQEQRDTMNEVLDLVNAARADAGVAALELDPALCQAAQVRAEECVGTFSHTRPDGTSYKTALTEAGITAGYVGENVATGYKGARQAVEGWLKSEGHRANILNGNYTKMGIGFEKNTGNRYQGFAWAQLFTD